MTEPIEKQRAIRTHRFHYPKLLTLLPLFSLMLLLLLTLTPLTYPFVHTSFLLSIVHPSFPPPLFTFFLLFHFLFSFTFRFYFPHSIYLISFPHVLLLSSLQSVYSPHILTQFIFHHNNRFSTIIFPFLLSFMRFPLCISSLPNPIFNLFLSVFLFSILFPLISYQLKSSLLHVLYL